MTIRLARTGFLALLLGLLAGPGFAQDEDASGLLVRMNRLEGQIRQMSGQIEQLQFDNRQLKDQVRKFQEDVEFRFQERSGGRSAAPPAAAPPAGAAPRPSRRSDAFDPDGDGSAPGAPRALGATAPSAPLTGADRRRLDSAFSEAAESSAPLDLNSAARGGAPVAGMNPSARQASNGPPAGEDTRADYDLAYSYVMQKQPAEAEAAFRRFIAAHPRDRLVPDATYWLGETYAQRGRHKEAAEQFLKISTDYTRSAKAPDALYRLGVSLAALGARDQACATLAEVERKYPTASASVKQGVDREQKRARCPT